jgi:parvulin-like peptidyl-prolyl isomerase
MNGKEIIFLVLLASATGVAGYTWNEKHLAGEAAKINPKQNPVTPVLPAKPNIDPKTKLPINPKLPGAAANPADQEQIGARHILIQYQGSMRAKPEVTRTKDEAKALAEKVLAEAKAPGADFAALAGKYSDEPKAAERGGDLGMFTRPRMVKEFSDAAFLLKVNEISGIVETKFGYHIIQRTK